jgi:hypothetical protein
MCERVFGVGNACLLCTHVDGAPGFRSKLLHSAQAAPFLSNTLLLLLL